MEFLPNLFHGLVTHVIDPDNFWILYGTDNDIQLYADYQEKLNTFYNNNGHMYTCNGDSLCREACVVVSNDVISLNDKITACHWKRAQVLQWDRSTNSVDVRFIDLGYSAIVSRNQLRQGLPQLFHILPPQAIPVSLASIKPLAQSWTNRAKTFFESRVLNKDILVSFVMKEDSICHHSVVLYTQTSDSSWHSLIHAMAKAELALMTDHIVTEYMSEEEANLCLQHMSAIQSQPQYGEEERLASPEGEGETQTANTSDYEKAMESPSIGAYAHTEDEFVPEEVQHDSVLTHSFNFNGVSGQEEKASPKMVPHVDFDSLAQRASFSISKLQQDRQNDIKQRTRANIMASIDTADAASVSEDQDWEAVRDFDMFDDIESQIYKGVHRQISNGEISEFSELEQLSRGRIGPVETCPLDNDTTVVLDKSAITDGDDVSIADVSNKLSGGTKSPDLGNVKADQEIQEYQTMKKIQAILSDYASEGVDVTSASIHSIVEPDVDVSCEELSIVLYSMLDHSIGKGIQDQEIVLAILETYSDTSCFAQAMREVLLRLKEEYVKQTQSVRLNGKHKEFGEMLSLVLTYASAWDERHAKDIQEFVLSLVANWVIFNKSRRDSVSQVFDSELLYLETAEMVLCRCHEQLKDKFADTLGDIVAELRHKLLHDSSPRWIRERILDLLLNIKYGTDMIRQSRKLCNASTQTNRDSGSTLEECNAPYCDQNQGGQSKYGEDRLSSSSPETHKVTPSFRRSQESGSARSTFFLQDEPSSVKEDMPWKSASNKYSSGAPQFVQKTRHYSGDEKSKSRTSPVSSPHFPPGIFIPAELASGTSHTKKRGIPKSLRNLPPHLLHKCQKDLAAQNFSYQEKESSVTLVSDSQTRSNLVSEADGLLGYHSPLSDNVQNSKDRIASPSEVKGVANTRETMDLSANCLSESVSGVLPVESYHEPVSEFTKQARGDISESRDSLEQREAGRGIMPNEKLQNFVEDSKVSEPKIGSAHDIEPSLFEGPLDTTDEQVSEEDIRKGNVIIKYSIVQLRQMNPNKSGCPLDLEELWEPNEILTKMLACSSKLRKRDETKAIDEINGRESLEQLCKLDEIRRSSPPPAGNSSDLEGHRAGDDFHDSIHFSQSSPFKNKTETEDEAPSYQSDHNQSDALSPLADVFVPKSNIRSPDREDGVDLEETEVPIYRLEVSEGLTNTGKDSLTPPATTDEPSEIWHENRGNNCDVRDLLEVKDSLADGKRKGKKKKTKFRPIDFFKSVTPIYDGTEDTSSNLDDLDEFSPEALRMYEELEKEEKENEASSTGDERILIHTRFGGSATSDPKRPSLFAEARQRYQLPKNRKPWCPGKRNCTRCGSEDHTVDQCEDDGSSLFR